MKAVGSLCSFTAFGLVHGVRADLLLMISILHYLKDPKLWEPWNIPYYDGPQP